MTPESERIPVPTNGSKPRAVDPGPGPVDGPGVPPAASTVGAASDEAATDAMIALSPTRLAVGFGVIASLILLLIRRRRQGR